MRKTAAATATAATLAAAVAFIAPWEGVELRAYRDIVGVPTICYGETRGVRMGDTATLAECQTMLAKGVHEFWVAMDPCLPDGLPVQTNTAFLSFSYNLGAKILCTSPTMSALLKKGDIKGACRAMMLFTKAGGKTVRGLVRRREAESTLCLQGLAG